MTAIEIIRKIMFDNNLNQTQFARSLGLDQTTISSWLKKKNRPQQSVRDKILEIYGIDIFLQAPKLDIDNDCVYVKFYEDIKASAGCGVGLCVGFAPKIAPFWGFGQIERGRQGQGGKTAQNLVQSVGKKQSVGKYIYFDNI